MGLDARVLKEIVELIDLKVAKKMRLKTKPSWRTIYSSIKELEKSHSTKRKERKTSKEKKNISEENKELSQSTDISITILQHKKNYLLNKFHPNQLKQSLNSIDHRRKEILLILKFSLAFSVSLASK